MREGYFLELIRALSKEIEKVSKTRRQVEQEVITLRLQVNAFVRVIRWLFPLGWLFKYYMNKEYEAYRKQIENQREELIKLHKKMKEEVKKPDIKDPRERIGRNAPCYCGSGKKYKKCCLDNKKILQTPKEINEALKQTANSINNYEKENKNEDKES